jgi:hypothetical protein
MIEVRTHSGNYKFEDDRAEGMYHYMINNGDTLEIHKSNYNCSISTIVFSTKDYIVAIVV